MHSRGIVGKDMNKFQKPLVAELGGIPIFMGFALGSIIAVFFSTYLGFELDLLNLIAGVLTVTFIGFIGLVDDIIGWKKGIRQWQHALFPIGAALPLMAVNISNPPMILPIIGLLPAEFVLPFGVISFGIIYSLVIVPIGVTGASNATNMLAGLNGLEAGLSFLIISTLFIVAAITGKAEAMIVAAAMMGTLLAFLRFNYFPAKIFGGDGLTLMSGASIAVISILGDMEKIGVALMALFFIELYLKAKSKFQAESFGIPTKEGLLIAPKEKRSLTHYFMGFGKATSEKGVVQRILLVQGVICFIVLSLSYLNYVGIISF